MFSLLIARIVIALTHLFIFDSQLEQLVKLLPSLERIIQWVAELLKKALPK